MVTQLDGSMLDLNDVMDHAEKYLTPEAQAFAKTAEKATALILLEQDPTAFKTIYFSVSCHDDKLDEAVEKMAIIMNDLVAKGQIHSILAPISRLRLMTIDTLKLPYAVFFFPVVSFANYDELMKHPCANLEGGIGPRL